MASPSRVQMPMTLEEFLKLPEDKPYLEYIDGRIEPKVSPQKKHGLFEWRPMESLNGFAEPAGLGFAFPELRCTFAGRSIVPDVAFLLDVHIAYDDHGELVDETTIPPDIHVEILSPEQTPRKMQDKMLHSASHGCSLGWLIDPEKKTIDVFRPGQSVERLSPDGVLKGEPVLPGYRLPVSEVFGWLKVRRPGPTGPADSGADPA